MSIIPISLFGVLSLLYFIAYGIKDALVWPFLLLGWWKQPRSMRPIRGQDPSGMKRARALREAHGPERVLRD
jgi:hypothetical protein